MIFDALGRLALGEVPDDAGAEAEQPSFVAVPLNRAVKRASVIALVGGLVFVPAPSAAPAAVGAWQQPLSKAPPRKAIPLGGPSYAFLSTQFTQNTANYGGYQQPLSRAVPRSLVRQGNAFVPLNTAQPVAGTETATAVVWTHTSVAFDRTLYYQSSAYGTPPTEEAVAITYGWQLPLGTAPTKPPVWQGNSLVPFNTAQFVPAAWWQPASRAAPRPPVWSGGPSYTFLSTAFTQNTVDISRWQQPLSKAAPRPPVWTGNAFVPFNTAQVIFNTIDYSLYTQPLSKAAPIPRAMLGLSFTPFDTAQAVAEATTATVSTHISVPFVRTLYYQARVYVFPPPAQVVADVYGWWQPLSRARDRSPVWAGGPSYALLSTQFTQNTVYWANYQQPLSRPADRPPVWQGTSLVPFDTRFEANNTIDYSLYMQPLSRAVPIPYTTFTVGYVFVPWDTVQVIPPPRPGGVQPPGFWYEEWERIADRQRKRKRPAPELIVAVDELPQDWQPSKVFKVSPRVIEALAQAQSIDDIRELARQETGQVRNMLNMVIAEYKRRVKDEDDIEIILMTMH